MTTNGVDPQSRSVDEQIGERVHMLMFRQRVRQGEIGRLLGIDQSAVSKKLRGSRPWSAHDLQLIAERFGVTVGSLFGEETDPRPNGGGEADAATNVALSCRSVIIGPWGTVESRLPERRVSLSTHAR